MRVLSAQALVALLFAVGIERALALPAAEPEAIAALEVRAAGDSQSDPILKVVDFNSRDSNYPGANELFDADCYAHLCQGKPTTMNYWDNPGDVNRKAEHGNGVGTHDPWADKKSRDKFKVKTPPEDDKHKWTSPEEWPPASAHQGGRNAVLFPATKEGQKRQATILSSRLYGSNPKIAQQKGDGSSKGSWWRITEWKGLDTPYCNKLNELLKDFDKNFDKNTGVLKVAKPDICTAKISDLKGLKFDVGDYAYATNDGQNYHYVGK